MVPSFFLPLGSHDQTELPAVGNLQENENQMEDSVGTFENGNEKLDLKKRSGILRKESNKKSPDSIGIIE
ncbi:MULTISPECIES: hypothetical protein [Leptospira]|uniref:Uncharacterized protein n=5 Tax=Leptospira borgpetersenii TaxID=174 RepID=M3GIA0_LEPBO|nr:hypothetical protein [Leptospira borgpetersenii]AXX17363.1 hypothetical protein C4Q31_17045 [Leptospira borgpetersenii serovar Ceylonica]EMG00702.1 hypothetical protein LEP1GSC123_1986 [Leptospira borgpetersenii str. 200701203]EMK12052.1 hypothetical protein LEP1GSC066_2296 [Leptospira sp. serovar Kenya str. Sh9]EMO11980.1 hypothetical protein LEP1GSC137_0957 [Leptospira borgpetersenii str. Noumea 25]ALO28091.1 hypothetical protein LBBP_03937 [Leptospira borgpetersenii serovar Ballum]